VAPVMQRNIVALTDGQRQLSAPCEAFLVHFQQEMAEPQVAVAKKRASRKGPAKA
jgi:LysR family carnitine catabolism transcriptional activator